MSTRTRPRARPSGTSYTARLRQRSAAPRPTRAWPAWLTSRRLPAALAGAAEAGHLGAALVEWPVAPVRGLLHVVAAAVLGVLAVSVYCGPNRAVLAVGIGFGAALPIGSVVAMLAGMPLYHDYPLLAALAVGAAELALAALLIMSWRRG